MERLNFNPSNLYEDEVAFPDPTSEIETRRQLNEGCKQIQTYINSVLAPKVEALEQKIETLEQELGTLSDLIGGGE